MQGLPVGDIAFVAHTKVHVSGVTVSAIPLLYMRSCSQRAAGLS
jgi:hypothetical protein